MVKDFFESVESSTRKNGRQVLQELRPIVLGTLGVVKECTVLFKEQIQSKN
jgi:hypothetical protein